MQMQAADADPREIKPVTQPKAIHMQSLLESMPIAIAMVDLDLRYLVTSQQWQEYFHLDETAIVGQPLHECILASHAHLEATLQSCHTSATPSQLSVRQFKQHNSVQSFSWQLVPWYGEDQTVAGVILSVQQQPEHSSCKLQLGSNCDQIEETHQRLERIIQQMPIAVIEWRPDLQIVDWNPAAAALFGYQREEVIGQKISLLIPEETRDDLARVAQALISNSAQSQDFTHNVNKNLTKDGRVIICEWHNTRLINASGELVGIASMAVDISDRKHTEAQVKEQEQFLRSIYDGVDCSMFVVDVTEDRNFLYSSYNQTAERWTGKTTADVAGQTPEERFGEAEGRAVRAAFQRCIDQGISITEEEHLTFRDREVWLMTTFNPIRDPDGRIHRIVGTVFDITNLKQIQATLQNTLQQSEYQSRFLRTVLDATPDWIFAKDQDFRYILANQSFAQGCGTTVEMIVGKTDLDLGIDQDLVFGNTEKNIRGFRTDDASALAGHEIINSFDPIILPDGSFRVFDTRKIPMRNAEGDVFAVLGVCRDFTDRHHAEEAIRQSEMEVKEKAAQLEQTLQELKQTQAQLVQNEKMSSLGQLVAGVAHEINNPVNFIYGNLSHANTYTRELLELIHLYQEHYPQPAPKIQGKAEEIDVEFLIEDLPKLLNSMKVGADRIQAIVASLRTFSRMDEAEMKAVNIHDGIDSTLMILQSRLKSTDQRPGIAIQQEYGDLPLVECYAGQLNQVFMNIVSNAIDALEEVVERDQRERTASDFTPTITIRTQKLDSSWIQITIADNGSGIPETIQQRLFDPFFTTKPVGKGTGMGLSISYQIVTEKHGGRLHCQSAPGTGTEFRIEIPLHQTTTPEIYR